MPRSVTALDAKILPSAYCMPNACPTLGSQSGGGGVGATARNGPVSREPMVRIEEQMASSCFPAYSAWVMPRKR